MRKTWMLLLLLLVSMPLFSSNYTFHTIKKGETLYRLSKRYNISVDELCKINCISDVSRVRSGMKLKIPTSVSYLDYILPVDGVIEDYITSHFRGIVIFPAVQKSVAVNVVEDGTVWFVDRINGYGLTVIIKHNDGYITTYSGLTGVTVKVGSQAVKGMVLGMTGILSKYKQSGLLFSVQYKGAGLRFDRNNGKFIKG